MKPDFLPNIYTETPEGRPGRFRATGDFVVPAVVSSVLLFGLVGNQCLALRSAIACALAHAKNL